MWFDVAEDSKLISKSARLAALEAECCVCKRVYLMLELGLLLFIYRLKLTFKQILKN